MERRTFVMSALTAASAARVWGANDRIRMGVVGVRSRGREHVDIFSKLPASQVVAVCDTDQAMQERAVAQVEQLGAPKPKSYADMRDLFAEKDIDAVSIANTNHWHALSTIWACEAGKDVYIEKPATHNLFEGPRMIAAARKHGRMVQVGMQSRSIAHKQKAIELLRDGVIGKVYMAKGLCYKRRKSIGKSPDGPIPAGVNYDLWLGPAQMRPFNPNRFHYNWHWFWDTGNGDIGNQGVHEMDVAMWGLGKTAPPKTVVSTGGKYLYDDDQETPNTQNATFDWGDGTELVFEVRGLITHGEGQVFYDGANTIGNIFYGADGYMTLDVDGFKVFKGEDKKLFQEARYSEPKAWDTTPHMESFQKAVRSRKIEDLTADIEVGVRAADLCHLANASYRAGGKKLTWNAAAESFDDASANRFVSREYRAPYVVK